jgi:hypothetical protein
VTHQVIEPIDDRLEAREVDLLGRAVNHGTRSDRLASHRAMVVKVVRDLERSRQNRNTTVPASIQTCKE